MWRFIATLIEWLVVFLVARSVITGVARFFRGMSTPETTPPAPRTPGELRSAGELRKDPVCETYISVPSPWAKIVKGETVYFCSKECMKRFKA
jgi:YHS domain-containing protein